MKNNNKQHKSKNLPVPLNILFSKGNLLNFKPKEIKTPNKKVFLIDSNDEIEWPTLNNTQKQQKTKQQKNKTRINQPTPSKHSKINNFSKSFEKDMDNEFFNYYFDQMEILKNKLEIEQNQQSQKKTIFSHF